MYAYMCYNVFLGCSLKEYIAPKDADPYPLPLSQALGWLRQLVQVLRLHQQHRIVHGDLKPENLMLRAAEGTEIGEGTETIVVVDYGTARRVSPPDFTLPEVSIVNC